MFTSFFSTEPPFFYSEDFIHLCSAMRSLYIFLGALSLGLGVLGIVLPLLPTTPFLLLTAALWLRASPRLYRWLITQKQLGPYIRNFQENRAIPLRAKIVSLLLLWGTILYCIFGVVEPLWLKLLLAAIAIGVTIHILSYKTFRKEPTDINSTNA